MGFFFFPESHVEREESQQRASVNSSVRGWGVPSVLLPAGPSCQENQMVKRCSDNTTWQINMSRDDPSPALAS